ncbi:MAG: hypothetical protein H6925_03225 [Holosporaceae bacterium]|nr:MAG: hypothetical protein H6925_03225 [Holosporaceae bacterium]
MVYKTQNIREVTPEQTSPLQSGLPANKEIVQYKSVSFFLERTAETIKRTTDLIQELESEVARLKYELMATENEYKNLQHMNQDFEKRLMGGNDLQESSSEQEE